MSAEHDYVVLTADLDFGSILAVTGRQKPSVIQIRDDLLTPSALRVPCSLAFGALRRNWPPAR
jgi:predicted nuclease of predicted toxin-antitoxin system